MLTPRRNLPCKECLVFSCCEGRYERIINHKIRKHKAIQAIVFRCSILHDYCKEELTYAKTLFKQEGIVISTILIEHPFEKSNETTKNWITFPFNL
jgi:hypothetical protein